MILSELLQRLEEMYPRSPLDGWASEYKRLLGNVPGDALDAAFRVTMNDWTKPTPPKPADILENVPAAHATNLRPARTEAEAAAWVKTHSYLQETLEKDWRNVLVRP